MESFCFKQFKVMHGRSAMKVNTDGVLLGAWLTLPSLTTSGKKLEILDIGTGTGVISLIIAQRLQSISTQSSIFAIDSDGPSATEAQDNFSDSPWPAMLEARHLTLQEMAMDNAFENRFDLITSNPPYFKDSLKAPSVRRSSARHNDNLSYDTLISSVAKMLKEKSIFSVVLPAEAFEEFIFLAREEGLVPVRICRVKTVSAGKVKRVLMEFKKSCKEDSIIQKDIPAEELLTIQERGDGPYTNEYRRLTGDLYLNF
ncbi:MAG: methyltransferase [Bacteroidales bacterium]|nr:methyltransferase [Bacteroidales bacterium]